MPEQATQDDEAADHEEHLDAVSERRPEIGQSVAPDISMRQYHHARCAEVIDEYHGGAQPPVPIERDVESWPLFAHGFICGSMRQVSTFDTDRRAGIAKRPNRCPRMRTACPPTARLPLP